jgi:hypothetical protein
MSRSASGYLHARYQDPATGLFLSVDPLVDTTGEPDLYASGKPTTVADPSGLEPGCGNTTRDDYGCSDAPRDANDQAAANAKRRSQIADVEEQTRSAGSDQIEGYSNYCQAMWIGSAG